MKPAAKKARGRRRTPQQERAQNTVDVIVAAARALVVEQGLDALSTNRIARRAGVSIGSVYQYFPSKRAIIAELRRRHQAHGEQIFRREAAIIFGEPVPVATRHFVEKMFEVHREDPALHRALELEGRMSGWGELERWALGLVRLYLQQHREELAVDDIEKAAFLVAVTVEALTHNAVLERPDLLCDDAFLDAVSRMLSLYLTKPAP
jgi:AcrR family transcriptional regulator